MAQFLAAVPSLRYLTLSMCDEDHTKCWVIKGAQGAAEQSPAAEEVERTVFEKYREAEGMGSFSSSVMDEM